MSLSQAIWMECRLSPMLLMPQIVEDGFALSQLSVAPSKPLCFCPPSFLKKVFSFETIFFWLSPSSLLHHSYLSFTSSIIISLSTICPHLTLLFTIYHRRSWQLALHHPVCPAVILGDLKVHVDKSFVPLASQFFNSSSLVTFTSVTLYPFTYRAVSCDLCSLEFYFCKI